MQNLNHSLMLTQAYARSLIKDACRGNPWFYDRQVRGDAWVRFTFNDDMRNATATATGPDGKVLATAIVDGDDCE